MVMSILLKLQTLEWDISRTIWRIEVSDGSFCRIFHALSFELNKVTPTTFWLKSKNLSKCTKLCFTDKLEVADKYSRLFNKKLSHGLANTAA